MPEKKYAHLGVSELRRLRQLEEENNRLKRLVAEWVAATAPTGQDAHELLETLM